VDRAARFSQKFKGNQAHLSKAQGQPNIMKASAPALRNAQLSAGMVAAVVLAYWPSSRALWLFWTDPDSAGTHGVLVALLSVWLFYRNRYPLGAVATKPSPVAMVLLALASLAWLVFWRAAIPSLHIILFPALMGLGIAAALGWQAARWVAFPIGFLYFAVPSWDVLVGPLQTIAAHATGLLAPLLGIPAEVQGYLVRLPGVGTFEIGRGCSGVNFFAIGLAVAALLGELEGATVLRRFSLLCIMGFAAVVSNWIRVLVIVDAGYTTNMRHVLVSRSHYMFGWILFSIVLFAFAWLFARPQAAPERRSQPPPASPGSRGLPAYSAIVLALIAPPLLVYSFIGTADASVAPYSFRAPGGTAGWAGPFVTHSDATAKPGFTYRDATGASVELVAFSYGARISPLVSEGDTAVTDTRKVSVDGLPYLETTTTDGEGRRMLVWSSYGERRFTTPLLSRLWYGISSLRASPSPSLFAFRTGCAASCDAARTVLTDFARTIGPQLTVSMSRPSPIHSSQGSL
jgi:exosortase